MVSQMKSQFLSGGVPASCETQSNGSCTGHGKMLLFCAETIQIDSCNFELSCLKMKKEDKHFGCLASLWLGTSSMSFHSTRSLVGHETLEDERHVVIKAQYKLIVLRFLCIIVYCMPAQSLHRESTNSMIPMLVCKALRNALIVAPHVKHTLGPAQRYRQEMTVVSATSAVTSKQC